MGSSNFVNSAYTTRLDDRIRTGTPTFVYHASVVSGAVAAKAHASLDPQGVGLRESRDSVNHPVAVPIALGLDLTGSMGEVPVILQKGLMKLMGAFLDDKLSGKKYLGDGYPAILVGGFDDCPHMHCASGTVQVGQFESGIEIDDNLTNLWITHGGGGTQQESVQLLLYFLARHTAHDHWDKRGKKGYAFIFSDEEAYSAVLADEVKKIFGDTIQGDIPLADIVAEVQERYHLFYVLPDSTSYSTGENGVRRMRYWTKLLGQPYVLRLEDHAKVCELIVSCVALHESDTTLTDLAADGVADTGMTKALAPLGKVAGGAVSKYDASQLPVLAAGGGGERL